MKNMCRLKNVALFALVSSLALLMSLPTSASARDQTAKMSLYELGARVEPTKKLLAGQARAWEVFLSPDIADTGAKALSIDMPLTGGEKIVLHKSSAARLGENSFVWRGFIDGPVEQLGEATLTLKNNVMAGRIQSQDRLLMIVPGAAGSHFLVEVDGAMDLACDGGVEVELPAGAPTINEVEPSRGVNDVVTIDVMSLYTPQALAGAGGVAAIEATIQNAVDVTNTAFQNSGSGARLNLVHTAQVAYNEVEDAEEDLEWVRDDPIVAALRDLHSADMVSLIVEEAGDVVGVGYTMNQVGPSFESSAFQVTQRDQAISLLAFAHEHGHNLGLHHDPANTTTPPEQASYPWSYGHFVDGSFRTVMSYSSQCTDYKCPVVAHFSNPNISYAGQPTGIHGSRDNHRTIDEGSVGFGTAGVAAAFRRTEDNFEENDSLGTAFAGLYRSVWLSEFGGLGIQADEDWFKIPVASGFERLLVDLRFFDVDGNIDLELVDAAGTVLAGSYSHSNDESIDFTVPVGGTDYYLRIYSDDNQGNHYDLWWIDALPSLPDLIVPSVTVDPTTLAVNQMMAVSGVVENQGTTFAAPSTLRFYLSTNSTITTSDTELTYVTTPPLLGGETFHSQPLFPRAPSEPGTYWIGACVDLVPDETSTTNNCSVGVEISVFTDDYYEENDSLAAAFDGINEQFWLSHYIEPGLQVDEDWYEIFVDGGSERVLVDIRFSHAEGDIDVQLVDAAGTVLTGSYSTSDDEYIDFAVPAGGFYYVKVAGANQGNSYDYWWDDMTPNDLRVPLVITSQSQLFGNQAFTTWVTVSNSGSATSNTSTLRYYVSTDSTISTADTELSTETVPILGVGTTSNHSTSLTAPATPGTYWIGACVDPVPGEHWTHNNCSTGEQIMVLTDDAYEPNDSMETAYTGLGEQVWLSTLSGSGVQADDDWYEIYVPGGREQVVVDLRFVHDDGNIELHLVDATGFAIATAYSSSDHERIDFTVPVGDTHYYILVFYGNQANQYDLSWQTFVPDASVIFRDGFESGDTSAW